MRWDVAGVIKRYAGQYIDRFGHQMTAQQKKVLRAVAVCREESLGTIRYRCTSCGEVTHVPRSCCNRHCPACQWTSQQQWLAKEQRLLLPCSYFLITFTLPADLRSLAMKHPEQVYRALFAASAESLREAATNPRHVGATARGSGFLGVLHTWGRDLSYHPHVHFLVPGGGLDAEGQWKPSRQSLFVPEQVLESLFKGKLKALLIEAGLGDQIPSSVWQGRFVVDSKAVGSGEHALSYLAPYVTRGCVANWRVSDCCGSESLEEASVTLQVKRSGKRRYQPMRLSVIEFIRRWLQHVLPCGLHRIRRYGFLHPSSRVDLEELRLIIAVALGQVYVLLCTEQLVMPEATKMSCPKCGSPMITLGYIPAGEVHFDSPARAPP